MQETTIAYLVHNCTDLDGVEDANNLFDKIDVSGKGKISLDDFYQKMDIVLSQYESISETILSNCNITTNK